MSACSLQGLMLQILDERNSFAKQNEEFYNTNVLINNVLKTINGMPHRLFAAELQARDDHPELKSYF